MSVNARSGISLRRKGPVVSSRNLVLPCNRNNVIACNYTIGGYPRRARDSSRLVLSRFVEPVEILSADRKLPSRCTNYRIIAIINVAFDTASRLPDTLFQTKS